MGEGGESGSVRGRMKGRTGGVQGRTYGVQGVGEAAALTGDRPSLPPVLSSPTRPKLGRG